VIWYYKYADSESAPTEIVKSYFCIQVYLLLEVSVIPVEAMDAIKTRISQLKGRLSSSSTNGASTKSGAGKTVLIDGATSFVATPVIMEFLEHGYKVRAQVRSESSADKVRATFPGMGEDQLEFVIVKDIMADGAYKDAVKGVVGVIHLASPFLLQVEDNERDLLQPAIQGTKQVLESVHKYGPDVKRVVITSSFSSIIDIPKGNRPGYTYTEADWNPVTWEEAKAGDGPVAYSASKLFAEKAAWEFVEKNKTHFSLAAICPPMIYGPAMQKVDIKHLNTSMGDIYRFMDGSSEEPGPTQFPAFADVRNVAQAHFKAFEYPEPGRYFVTSGNFLYNDVCQILRDYLPDRKDKIPDPEATPRVETFKVDNTKARTVLGIDFIPKEKTFQDAAASLVEIEKRSASD
jgi:nucleoside-diphosphate-sugar epimerase